MPNSRFAPELEPKGRGREGGSRRGGGALVTLTPESAGPTPVSPSLSHCPSLSLSPSPSPSLPLSLAAGPTPARPRPRSPCCGETELAPVPDPSLAARSPVPMPARRRARPSLRPLLPCTGGLPGGDRRAVLKYNVGLNLHYPKIGAIGSVCNSARDQSSGELSLFTQIQIKYEFGKKGNDVIVVTAHGRVISRMNLKSRVLSVPARLHRSGIPVVVG